MPTPTASQASSPTSKSLSSSANSSRSTSPALSKNGSESSLSTPLPTVSQIPSPMALPTELQNATQSDSRSSSPGAEQYLFPRPSRLTFFDIALRRTTNHRFGHLDVVNTDSYKTATISCEDDALMDLLCRQIPRADEYTMKTLAYMQTWRLGILRSNIHDLQVELSRFEHMASSVANEINEREEANAQEECELFSLFYQVDNEQEDDTESEDDDVEVVSSLHQCPEEEGEEFEEEESDNGYGSRYNCLM